MKKVATLKDIAAGGCHVLHLKEEDIRIALFNIDGKVYCIEDVCTHDDGPLAEGPLDGKIVQCPRHGATFDVTTGAALTMPAVAPVPSYPVEVRGEDVFVDLEG